MPLVNGDIVAMWTGLNARIQPQPPRFGKVENAAGFDILWEDGFEVTLSVGPAVDVLHDVTAANQNLIGKVVRLDINLTTVIQPSPAYDALVISAFRRERGGDGTISADRVLVQLLSNQMYLEVPVTQVTRLDNR
jgi:hypothetical protein